MTLKRHDVTITTSTAGSATGYTAPTSGAVHQVRYVPSAGAAMSTATDLDIVGETTGIVVANEDGIDASAAFTRAYRQPTHGVDGTPLLYAASGTNVEDRIAVGNERIKLSVANAGSEKTGTFHIFVGDE